MKQNLKLFVVIVIFSLLLVGCTSVGQKAAPTPTAGENQDFGAIISATGVVVPERWAALSARSQAVVVEVLVTEGEKVSAGQPLVRLDGQAAAQANLGTAQFELTNAQQALDTLKENAAAETAHAQQAVANAMQAVEDAQEDVDKLVYRRASDDLIKQTQDEIDLAKKAVSRAEDTYKLFKKRPDGDTLKAQAELALVKARIHLDNRISYLNWYTGTPDEIDAAKYRAALAVAQANLDRTRTEYDRRKDGPDKNLLELATARLALAKTRVQAAQEAVGDLELRAPFDGVVCNLDARVGEWVVPGMTILELGDLDQLRVETTDLSEIDAARVHPQDRVLITFDALPNVVINGKVHWVANKSGEGSGVNYSTIVMLDTIPADLRWGMTAFVDIKVSE